MEKYLEDFLVGGLEHQFYFPRNIGFRLSSQLTNSYFSEGFFPGPPTSFGSDSFFWDTIHLPNCTSQQPLLAGWPFPDHRPRKSQPTVPAPQERVQYPPKNRPAEKISSQEISSCSIFQFPPGLTQVLSTWSKGRVLQVQGLRSGRFGPSPALYQLQGNITIWSYTHGTAIWEPNPEESMLTNHGVQEAPIFRG